MRNVLKISVLVGLFGLVVGCDDYWDDELKVDNPPIAFGGDCSANLDGCDTGMVCSEFTIDG